MPTKEPKAGDARLDKMGAGSSDQCSGGNLSIIKSPICTNKFEWERAEGAAAAAAGGAAAVAATLFAAAAAAVVEEQSIWLLNLTIRIYQWVAGGLGRGGRQRLRV